MKILYYGLDKTTIALLSGNGITTEQAEDVTTAEDLSEWLIDGLYDAVVVNLDVSGFGIYLPRLMRTKGIKVIIIGICHNETDIPWTEKRSIFLESGGDDLLCSPVNPRELTASLMASARRIKGSLMDVYEFVYKDAVLKVNLAIRSVTVNRKRVSLTGSEYKILATLTLNNGRDVSKDELLREMYTLMDEPKEKIINVFVCKLRKKLNDAHPYAGAIIEIVWGKGYRINPETVRSKNKFL